MLPYAFNQCDNEKFNQLIDEYYEKMVDSISKFSRHGNGWTLDTLLKIELVIAEYLF